MILALDLGMRRVGVARSRSGLLAEAVETIELKTALDQPQGLAELTDRLRQMCMDEPLQALVIGLPVKADGEPSHFGEQLRQLGQKIGQRLEAPVYFEDETLSTVEGGKDHEAARIILEQYLANQ